MNFLSSILHRVSETINSSADFSIVEVKKGPLLMDVIADNGNMTLHRLENNRCALLLSLQNPLKVLRLFLLTDTEEAQRLFTIYSSKLLPIIIVCPSVTSSTSKLHDLCTHIRNNSSSSVVHLCVELKLLDALQHRHPEIIRHINSVDDTNSSPLHLACRDNRTDARIVQELLLIGADLSMRDANGETAIHLAARHSVEKLKILLRRPTNAIDLISVFGETALHLACLENQPDCLDQLLINGADPLLSESYKYPIHCAVKGNSIECVQLLVRRCPILLSTGDGKYGGTALHWAKSKEMVVCLLDLEAPIDALSNTRDTPLHIMLKYDRRDCVNALLTRGASASLANHEGETPLHIAIPTDDLAMVRSLVVYDADINMMDRNGITPRHLAATLNKKNSAAILYTLHMVGARRCPAGQKDCTDGCSMSGKYKGKKISPVNKERESAENMCEDLLAGVTYDSVNTPRDACNNGFVIPNGHRVLCLDGGGIRGLVLIVTLMQLQKMLDVAIKDCFDWISGTSTGGILALGLTFGKSPRECMGMYFKLKDRVFCGSKPYVAENLEAILKDEFGTNTLMIAVEKPKVIVTAVLADRHPPELHMFRNYENPFDKIIPAEKRLNPKYAAPPKPQETKVWEAARSSGAAPTFFRAALNRFLDGGLMSNNPTLDTLTEIHEYTTGLRLLNRYPEVLPIACVLSLGTGRMPQTAVKDIDIYRPGGIVDAYKVLQGAQSLLKLVVEQATSSEGRPVDRARAWCGMIGIPFFRLSPPLSCEIMLDETDDDKLILMCWEAMVYLHRNKNRLESIASLLRRPSSNQSHH